MQAHLTAFISFAKHTNTRMLTFIIRDSPANSYSSCVFLCWNDTFSEQIYTSSLCSLPNKNTSTPYRALQFIKFTITFTLQPHKKTPNCKAQQTRRTDLNCCFSVRKQETYLLWAFHQFGGPEISQISTANISTVQHKLYKPCSISTVF